LVHLKPDTTRVEQRLKLWRSYRLNCIVTSWTAGAFAGFVVVICTMYWM
jgi:hypothetical protein